MAEVPKDLAIEQLLQTNREDVHVQVAVLGHSKCERYAFLALGQVLDRACLLQDHPSLRGSVRETYVVGY